MLDPRASRRAFTGPGFEDGQVRADLDRIEWEQARSARQRAMAERRFEASWRGALPQALHLPPDLPDGATLVEQAEHARRGMGSYGGPPGADERRASTVHTALQKVDLDGIIRTRGDAAGRPWPPTNLPIPHRPCLRSLQPPPLATIDTPNRVELSAGSIRDCMAPATSWPATGCDAPCADHRPTYVLPDDRAEIAQLFPVRALTSSELPLSRDWVSLASAERHDAIDYVRSAVALLHDNYDLVEWATCTACSWSQLTDASDCADILDQLRTWVDVSEPAVGFPTYLVDRWHVGDASLIDPGFQTGAFAVATDLMDDPANCSARWWDVIDHPCISQIPSEGRGVVVAAGHGIFRQQQGIYLAYRSSMSGPTTNAMAALLWMASKILHELMHLAGEEPVLFGVRMPGVSADLGARTYDPCWALQYQTEHNFVWAMTQRYPDLASVPHVGPYFRSLGDPDWFMGTF